MVSLALLRVDCTIPPRPHPVLLACLRGERAGGGAQGGYLTPIPMESKGDDLRKIGPLYAKSLNRAEIA
jgi:hypothetical protein